MQNCFLESLKLKRIGFFIKLVTASDYYNQEKQLAIQ